LLAALRHFLANERDYATAQKRGGQQVLFRFDVASAEKRYSVEPAHLLTPEKIFEKRWVLTLLDEVLARLREEFAQVGLSNHFDLLVPFLQRKPSCNRSYADIAAALDMTEPAVRQAVRRLRQRFYKLLRSEVARIVAGPDEIDDELQAMLRALQEN
jgi:RNA polymerase sigma-70 factor (ECF subfamily)